MPERNVWAYFLAIPNTLDILNLDISAGTRLDYELDPQLITDVMYGLNYDIRVGDIFLFIVTHGNGERIDRLVKELKAFPEEWSPEKYLVMLETLENARKKYIAYMRWLQ